MRARRLNEKLIRTIKEAGFLKSAPVEHAFRSVLRHDLLPSGVPLEQAYADGVIPLKRADSSSSLPSGTVSSSSTTPSLLAAMMEASSLLTGQSILHVGSGPGYLDALVSRVVADSGRVVTLEIDRELARTTGDRLETLGYANVLSIAGDGMLGYPQATPFDRVICTASCAAIPETWTAQLREGGLIVAPFAFSPSANLYPVVVFRKEAGRLTGTVAGSLPVVRFVPLYGPNVSLPLVPDPTVSEVERAIGLWEARNPDGREETAVRYLTEMLYLAQAIESNEDRIEAIRPAAITGAVDSFLRRHKRLGVHRFELVLAPIGGAPPGEVPPGHMWRFKKGTKELFVSVTAG